MTALAYSVLAAKEKPAVLTHVPHTNFTPFLKVIELVVIDCTRMEVMTEAMDALRAVTAAATATDTKLVFATLVDASPAVAVNTLGSDGVEGDSSGASILQTHDVFAMAAEFEFAGGVSTLGDAPGELMRGARAR